ncbi:MAG: hypothetical protein ACI4LA_03410 [Emergencia sp.]
MKIKKSTIVWFVISALCLGCIFADTDGESLGWSDAIYVEDAKVSAENEGKLVAISGYTEVLENAEDDLIGVSFPSPKVNRYVEEKVWDESAEEWIRKQVYEGKSDNGYENGLLIGKISIGDFILDEELVKRICVTQRNVKKEDFSDEDIAHMESIGSVFDEAFDFYYGTGSYSYKDSCAYLINWDMWDPSKDEGVTVVGVQKGNTLTYQPDVICSADRIMNEAEFQDEAAGSPINMKYGFAVLALVFALLGVRSLKKANRKKQKEFGIMHDK